MDRKQLKKIMKTLEHRYGFEDVTRKGHIKMRSPKGEIFVLPSTASDHRAGRNACAMLKRAGYPVN